MNQLSRAIVAAAICLLTANTMAQNKPFPQGVSFTGCIKPSGGQTALNNAVIARYESYKDMYLSSSNEYIEHAKESGATTTSEAHGYGMIVFALMAGQDPEAKMIFDKMFGYYKKWPSTENHANMSWLGGKKASSASDGDMDIAYSLLLAHDQWGSAGTINYLREARKIIRSGIYESDIHRTKLRVGLGDWDTTDATTGNSRPSDWMGDHLRAFSKVSGEPVFTAIADNNYELWKTFVSKYSSGTGCLISDFVWKNPVELPPTGPFIGGEPASQNYSFNSCRVPWRFAMDYMHYQTAAAKEACKKFASFASAESDNNPTGISEGYTMSGNGIGGGGNVAFVSPFACAAAVAGNQGLLDACWNYMKNTDGGDVYVCGINLMCMFAISGNWWKPEVPDMPTPIETGVILDDFKKNTTFTGAPRQNALAERYGHTILQDFSKGGGLWFLYRDALGSIVQSGGKTLDSSEAGAMINPDQGLLSCVMKTSTCSKPADAYAGVGCQFIGTSPTDYKTLSNMSGLTLRLKGTGRIRVSIATEDVAKLFPNPDDAWGFYGYNIQLPSEWSTVTIDTSLLIPPISPDCPSFVKNMNWQGGKSKALAISFEPVGGDATLNLEKIILAGCTYSDFGVGNVPIVSTSSTAAPTFSMQRLSGDRGVALSVPLDESADIVATIHTLQGKEIARTNASHGAGVANITLAPHSASLSAGIYVVSVGIGNQSYSTKLTIR